MSLFERIALVVAVLVGYSLLCLYCGWRYRRKQILEQGTLTQGTLTQGTLVQGTFAQDAVDQGLSSKSEAGTFLVAYASQSGTAATIAKRSAASLAGHHDYQLLPLNKVTEDVLKHSHQALFVVSTYGEGEAPDNGVAFAKRYLHAAGGIDLSHLQFSVLALGDKLYQQFCAFGHQLHVGLCQLGAIPLFDPMEACATEGYSQDLLINQWRNQLGLFELDEQSDEQLNALWQDTELEQWQLMSRDCLNPLSPGAPAYHLRLCHPDINHKRWQAGDIVEITIPEEVAAIHHESQPEIVKRKYSIASIPEDGSIDLVVRQHRNAAGHLGLGSGWLTKGADIQSEIRLRLCDNPSFHGIATSQPMILIGSGTGMAGLRAHIKARALQKGSQNWLLFGERSRQHDGFFAEEIKAWQQSKVLARVDLAFSREPEAIRYVQDLLLDNAEEVRRWLANDAVIFVCGNRQGMAQGVDQVLREILGQTGYDKLIENDGYRRDVY
ncbi:sulfite reductase subunit alpha [Alteromonadaceae bacterium BrNp21-10]|nr:sulfite reductase subunit alpha [Alteromonadaceae bacterium BrNp21-10]